MKRSVIIVDDHNLFAQSLRGLVNSFQDFEVVAVLKNGQELVEYFQANKKRPDIVLLDMRMPVMNGLETMTWLHGNFKDQKVLALTMEHEEEIIIKMIRLGCRGYLLKDIEPEEFFYALDCVNKSGFYMNDETSAAMDCSITEKSFKNLTQRELVFINHACSEMTYKEVAEKMNVSPKTIDGYRESLFNKLDLKSRVGLVLYAVKHKMVKI